MINRLMLAAVVILLSVPVVHAQTDPRGNVFLGGPKDKKQKNPTSRSVHGTVTNAEGKPLNNALVTLTNEDTHERLTFFTKHEGSYYFDGLSFTTDYKLTAQYKDRKSTEKTLSQYDRQPNIVRILQVDPAATAANAPADKPAESVQSAK